MRKVFLDVKVQIEIEIPEGQAVCDVISELEISGDFLNDYSWGDYEIIDSK